MSGKTIDGTGPAFPVPMIPCDRDGGYTEVYRGGMTMREYYAGQAMVGLLASPGEGIWKKEMLAAQSVGAADALIAALKEPS